MTRQIKNTSSAQAALAGIDILAGAVTIRLINPGGFALFVAHGSTTYQDQ